MDCGCGFCVWVESHKSQRIELRHTVEPILNTMFVNVAALPTNLLPSNHPKLLPVNLAIMASNLTIHPTARSL